MTDMLAAMRGFIDARSGLCARDYIGAEDALRADRRAIARNGRDARAMLAYLQWAARIAREYSGTEAAFAAALPRSVNRLAWNGATWNFTPCQFAPVERRAAACRWLAAAVATYLDNGMPHGRGRPDAILRAARFTFGAAIARRWFT